MQQINNICVTVGRKRHYETEGGRLKTVCQIKKPTRIGSYVCTAECEHHINHNHSQQWVLCKHPWGTMPSSQWKEEPSEDGKD